VLAMTLCCVCLYTQGHEFTEQYRLEFQRVTGGRWFRYRKRRGQEVSVSFVIGQVDL